jgi:hypothetical protein
MQVTCLDLQPPSSLAGFWVCTRVPSQHHQAFTFVLDWVVGWVYTQVNCDLTMKHSPVRGVGVCAPPRTSPKRGRECILIKYARVYQQPFCQ